MNQLMKRVLSVLLVVCLLCSALPSAFAAEGGGFTDVSKDHWAYDAITEAVAAGYFKGVSDTAFDPEGTLTRAMLVTVLARAAGAETDDNASTGFSDVAVGTWYTGAVAWAAENGVVTGDGDGTFAPDRAATRQETATIFLRLLKLLNKTLPEIEEVKTFTDAADIAAWAEEAVETMQTAGVLTGYPDGSFLPQNPLTRAEAATLLCRFLKAAEDPLVFVAHRRELRVLAFPAKTDHAPSPPSAQHPDPDCFHHQRLTSAHFYSSLSSFIIRPPFPLVNGIHPPLYGQNPLFQLTHLSGGVIINGDGTCIRPEWEKRRASGGTQNKRDVRQHGHPV